MNYAAVKKNDIANGPGVRVSIFVSGCRHRCPGCFNKEAQNFTAGEPYTEKVEQDIISAASADYVAGLSLLGGEPFERENRAGLLQLCKNFRKTYPNKTIWCYTGFSFEELLEKEQKGEDNVRALLEQIDILVDGRFEKDKKSAALLFRGSSNQRIIDVKKTLSCGKAVIAKGKWERTMGRGGIEEA